MEVLTHDESVFSAHRDDCAVYRPQQRRHNVLNVLKCVSLEEKKTKTLVICILTLNRTASKRSKIFSLSHPIKNKHTDSLLSSSPQCFLFMSYKS